MNIILVFTLSFLAFYFGARFLISIIHNLTERTDEDQFWANTGSHIDPNDITQNTNKK